MNNTELGKYSPVTPWRTEKHENTPKAPHGEVPVARQTGNCHAMWTDDHPDGTEKLSANAGDTSTASNCDIVDNHCVKTMRWRHQASMEATCNFVIQKRSLVDINYVYGCSSNLTIPSSDTFLLNSNTLLFNTG